MVALLLLGLALPAPAQDFPVDPNQPTPVLTPRPTPSPTPERRPAAKPSATPTVVAKTAPALPEIEQSYVDALAMGPPELVGPPELSPGDAAAQAELAKTLPETEEHGPFQLLDETIAPGERRELRWKVGESFAGSSVNTPVIVIHGTQKGPRLCLAAAVHGDELNGVEVVRRVANETPPQELSGTLIALPIVNLLGFSRGSRYLPDRRDLNRYFPGTAYGSAASRIAFSLFKNVIRHCDALVDFHTGSFDRANLPQVRGDLTIPGVLDFTSGFGATPVLHSPGTRGMLRLAATDYGIPAVTFEVGAPLRLEPDQIDFAVQAIVTLMHKMGMTRSYRLWAEPQATFYESKWVRSDSGGMLFTTVRLGDRVREGQRLGKIVDPIRNEEFEITSPFRGRVIGMALNQLVLPGFAAYHIGIETSEQQAAEDAAAAPASPDALEQLEGDQMREQEAPSEDGPPSEAEPRTETE